MSGEPAIPDRGQGVRPGGAGTAGREAAPGLDREALLRAVSAAIESGSLDQPGVSRELLRAAGVRLAAWLADGEVPASDADPALAARLLDEMQVHVVRAWIEHVELLDGRAMTEALAAFDTMRIELRRRARRASRSLAFPDGYEFAAGVAHDLRSPLTSILFLAETLFSGQSGAVNDTQRRQLGIIYSAALGLTSVTSDIIELVRGGDGLTEREPALFSVTEILESVHDIVRPMAEEKGLGVHLFPPAIDHRFGFPVALSRVLLNLTTNGLKFTDTGFVEIAVRATSPMRLEFSVRDTGRGYAPEALETLYEPFRRTRAGKGFGFSGSGLGLAISRKLIAAMGSSLQVETRPRWGTRFYFEVELPPGPSGAPEDEG